MFGTLASPCGPALAAGVPTFAEGQNAEDTLPLGVANDSGFEGAPGSGSDMLNAARAFAQWCNDQGGVRGLKIEIVDLDAGVSGVPLAMEKACAEVFALVGGGWTFDDQMYPRFHECGLASFPAFALTAAATKANGRAQAIPGPIDLESTTWLAWIEKTFPDAVDNVAIIHPDLMPTKTLADKMAAVMEVVGGFGEPLSISFDPSGPDDWASIVQRLDSENIRAVSFIGAPEHLVDLYSAMSAAGFVPDVVFADGNLVSDVVLDEIPAESLANLRVRSIHPPFTEAVPALVSYAEMMATLDPPGPLGGLGVSTMSALLFFVTAANACLDLDGNVLERECALTQALMIASWTAGGLHAPTNPSLDAPTSCIVVLGTTAGTWSRVHPVRGSTDDSGEGFDCNDDGVVSIEGDFGDVSVGFDSTRLN